jgi:hypothetical protein
LDLIAGESLVELRTRTAEGEQEMQHSMQRALVLLLLWAAVAKAQHPIPVFPKPPRLATTEAELERDKKAPDFAERREAAIKAADALLAEPVPLPDGNGSWIFYYACPDDGLPLQMITPMSHQCPRC